MTRDYTGFLPVDNEPSATHPGAAGMASRAAAIAARLTGSPSLPFSPAPAAAAQ
jgi:hypothetical protein